MFQLDLKCRKSIYEQVVDNVKEIIITGILKTEEKLPSVRELSKALTVNPNTVQKAYKELERQGFVYTVSGLGCFVCPADNRITDKKQMKEAEERLKNDILELFYLGMNEDGIRGLLRELIDERGEEK